MAIVVTLYQALYTTILLPSLSCSSLHTTLSQFELLTPRHIKIRVERDAVGQAKQKTLTLPVFGRKISLSIKPGLPESLLSPNANLQAFHANRTKSRIDLDPNDFHQGFIKGHPYSRVNSFYHEGMWTIHVVHPTMSFSVEPLDFHTGYDRNRQMVAYRHRDIKMWKEPGKPFCKHFQFDTNSSSPLGYQILEDGKMNVNQNTNFLSEKQTSPGKIRDKINPTITDDLRDGVENNVFGGRRKKRDLKSSKVCDILAIADYTFYSGIGGKSVHKTTKLLIQLYAIANDVFSSTKFYSSKKFGIQIRGMEILTSDNELWSNVVLSEKVSNDGKSMVMELIEISYYKEYCLVHVSTQRLFRDNIMGLALTAVGKTDIKQGLCGSRSKESLNIGLSTSRQMDRNVHFPVYSLVVVHELGHSFGARHDDIDESPSECVPPEELGGNYIMWPKTNNGISPNNFKFSPCSIKSISKVLQKRTNCLMSEDLLEHNLCGNGVLDYGEDCDAGDYHLEDPYGCCTPKCRFTPNAICSPFNHPCCRNCIVAPEKEPCTNEIEHECSDGSFCDGINFDTCPRSRAKPNGHPCVNHGECQNGICINLCGLTGQRKNPPEQLKPCNCDTNKQTMCSICCNKVDYSHKNNHSSCESVSKSYENGMPCLLGFCKDGECVPSDDMDKNGWYVNRAIEELKSKQQETPKGVQIGVGTVGLIVLVVLVIVGGLFVRRINNRH